MYVTVGCQTFEFSAVDALAAAVQKAREYNKENQSC